MKNFVMLRWFIIALSSLVAMGIVQFKGLFVALWMADISGLSFIILSLYLILTGFIGVISYRLSNNPSGSKIYEENLPFMQGCWYSTELLMALGLMGTLIGFSIMLGVFIGVDMNNLIAVKGVIFNMAGGMSTAILTTLVGLITSQLIKLQLINLDISLPE